MEILHLMVPIAIILVIIAIALFFWAVRTGQFDDLERQGYNILLDDETKQNKHRNENKKSKAKGKNEQTSDVSARDTQNK
ncbi:cbb3-type cytochrome oxidase assembly protein CcoS [Aliidiomarina indica]|uniref:cbb3-type cytochrome oxidase assembly protein CcoS n=1 Tax=Aliidiomarina indica TaxID=2749147 RepID=UPI00188E3F6D|nr:cbb3-type cytochrome oxidase assembly protein CcoS [Aliidiomarina indica]